MYTPPPAASSARIPRATPGVLNGTASVGAVPSNQPPCSNFKASWRSKTICQNCSHDKKLHPSPDGKSSASPPAKQAAPSPQPAHRVLPSAPPGGSAILRPQPAPPRQGKTNSLPSGITLPPIGDAAESNTTNSTSHTSSPNNQMNPTKPVTSPRSNTPLPSLPSPRGLSASQSISTTASLPPAANDKLSMSQSTSTKGWVKGKESNTNPAAAQGWKRPGEGRAPSKSEPAKVAPLVRKLTNDKVEKETAILQVRSASDLHAAGVTTYFRVLNHLLNAMGLNEENIKEIETIAAKGSIEQTTNAQLINAAPITDSALSHLESILVGITAFLDVQHDLRLIIKGQALIRGYLARKRYIMLQKYVDSSLRKRNEGFREVCKRERLYVNNLRVVVNNYLIPLKENVKGYRALITEKEMTTIFSNVEGLLTVHEGLLQQLETIQQRWPEVDGVGDVFLTMAPFFRAYGEYVNNFQDAVEMLMTCTKKDRFSAFLNEIYQNGIKDDIYVDLHGLLSAPLNHISGYEALILMMVENTPNSHKDYSSLMHSFAIISGTSKFIQDVLSNADNLKQIHAVQDKLQKDKWPSLSDNVKRQYIREGPCFLVADVTKKSSKEKAFLFVFNDVIVIASPVKNAYKTIDRVDMDQAVIEDILDPSDLHAIKISQHTVGNARSYNISFANMNEKAGWMVDLMGLVSYYQNNRVFGAPLKKLFDAEPSRPLPHIIEKLVKYLDMLKAPETEGIFRVSGVFVNVKFLKDSFDRAGIGKDPEVNLAQCSVHDLTGVFKSFFREMPEPLLPFALYEPIVKLATKLSIDNDVDSFVVELNKLLSTLPRENKTLLKFLLKYLAGFEQYVDLTKMTRANLSIVFAPNLCRPVKETIDYSLQLGKVNLAVEIMLNNVDRLTM